MMSLQKVKVRGQMSRSQRSMQILPPFERFRTITPVWIHRWLHDNAHSLKWHRRLVFQGHLSNFKVTGDKTIADFDPNCVFPDCNSSLNSPTAMRWFTKLEIDQQRCPIVFQGHLSIFKVTGDIKLPILTLIGRFRIVTPVWFHWWLWNDAHSLKWHRRVALLFLAATKQLKVRSPRSRSQRSKPNLAIPGP